MKGGGGGGRGGMHQNCKNTQKKTDLASRIYSFFVSTCVSLFSQLRDLLTIGPCNTSVPDNSESCNAFQPLTVSRLKGARVKFLVDDAIMLAHMMAFNN